MNQKGHACQQAGFASLIILIGIVIVSLPSTTTAPAPTITTPSNPYNLISATGSVKVMVKAQNGNLGFTPQLAHQAMKVMFAK